jgi:hypothetical protein
MVKFESFLFCFSEVNIFFNEQNIVISQFAKISNN